MRAWLSSVLVVATLSCVHVVTQETRPQPVEAGVAASFTDPHALTWDFGDASPRVTGREVTHVFGHSGRFVVQAFEGDTLLRRVTTVVEPRPVFHAVPPSAVSMVLARNADDLAPAIDLGERAIGAASMQRWLDDLPLLSFVLDQGSGRSALVDPREGLGVFTLDDPQVTVSFVGITDPVRALPLLSTYLTEHGWEAQPTSRFRREGQQLEVFVDRGVLYAALGPVEAAGSAKLVVSQASHLGLESNPTLAEALNELPSGGFVVIARSTEPGTQWSLFSGAIALTALEARFGGRVTASAPLWKSPDPPSGRLLEHAPEGPFAAVGLSVPPKTLASLVFGNPGTARRERLARDFGSDVEQAFDSLSGVVDAAAYFDAESFFRSTVENEGRPSPRGTLLVEAAVTNSMFLAHFLEAVLLQNMFRTQRAQDKGLNVYRFSALGEPVEVAVTPSTLFMRAGEAVTGRPAVDLVAAWKKQFDGAFAPGHVSALIDVGQLRRELMVPRHIEGLDPRRVVTAQAIAQTLLDRLTQLEVIVLDVAPDAHGATVQAAVRVRAIDARHEEASGDLAP